MTANSLRGRYGDRRESCNLFRRNRSWCETGQVSLRITVEAYITGGKRGSSSQRDDPFRWGILVSPTRVDLRRRGDRRESWARRALNLLRRGKVCALRRAGRRGRAGCKCGCDGPSGSMDDSAGAVCFNEALAAACKSCKMNRSVSME